MITSTVLSTPIVPPAIDELCGNTFRYLTVDMVQKANSGRRRLPPNSTAMAHALWDGVLKFIPRDPLWSDRGPFVLSAGRLLLESQRKS